MSSARRRAASRANGKKSHGPVTPEGKARSAANATRHGLAAPGRLADSVCLSNETPAHYVQLHEALIAEYTPATTTEHLLVEEMAVARWRLQRAWTMENALLDNQMDRMMGDLDKDYETMDETTRTTLAFRDLAEKSPSLQVLQRYESRLSRQFERCLRRLAALRVTEPGEPNPKNGHSQNANQLPDPAPPPGSQPVPAPGPKRQSPISPAQSTPAVDEFHPGPHRDDSGPLPGPAPALPRAA